MPRAATATRPSSVRTTAMAAELLRFLRWAARAGWREIAVVGRYGVWVAIVVAISCSVITGGAVTGRPAAARITSARISPALWYRLRGFLARALSTTASTSAVTSRLD